MLSGYIHSGDITFHPYQKGIVYYATKTHGLLISEDDGENWRSMKGLAPTSFGAITVDPRDKETIYACSRGVWKGPTRGY